MVVVMVMRFQIEYLPCSDMGVLIAPFLIGRDTEAGRMEASHSSSDIALKL